MMHRILPTVMCLVPLLVVAPTAGAAELDAGAIEQASGTKTTTTPDGVVRIGWSRDDVAVEIDGMAFPPAAGLGSWAAFKDAGQSAMVMGDTVVFQDEVDAAMDAAFAHGLRVTALHNHFFFDQPKVYFMHIGGHGEATKLAAGVKAVWDAIKHVRAEGSQPAERFGGPAPTSGGRIDADRIEKATGLEASRLPGGVVKVSKAAAAHMHGVEIGGSMGLSSWAAFCGGDKRASVDGDFIMTGQEVQPVLQAMRKAGFHIVALHNHMIGEEPAMYFTHYWGVGPAEQLAQGFKAVLDAQAEAEEHAEALGHEDHEAGERGDSTDPKEPTKAVTWSFDDAEAGKLPAGFRAEGTNQRGPVATWVVKADRTAPSEPNVLALTDTKQSSGSTYNVCWTNHVQFKDGTLEVQVKAGTGKEDEGGGPIWRVQDKDNYYVARWNPLEDNFRLYYVKDSHRVQLDSARVRTDSSKWHTIKIEQQDDEIECYFDGKELLKAHDKTFTEAGGIGLWTKADAASFFDGLKVSTK